ncbi:MAG TPA: DUF3429 family protein [Devosia sp.]|nr:DUF3429 family protein [Devosia sp.]
MGDRGGEQGKKLLVLLLVLCAPLIAGLAGMLFSGLLPMDQDSLERAIIGYGTLVLGFFSGARLGRTLLTGDTKRSIWLVLLLPALGLLVVVMPFTTALALLIVGFGAQGAWDSWSGFRGALAKDYAAQRRAITLIICLTLVAILVLHGLANA